MEQFQQHLWDACQHDSDGCGVQYTSGYVSGSVSKSSKTPKLMITGRDAQLRTLDRERSHEHSIEKGATATRSRGNQEPATVVQRMFSELWLTKTSVGGSHPHHFSIITQKRKTAGITRRAHERPNVRGQMRHDPTVPGKECD